MLEISPRGGVPAHVLMWDIAGDVDLETASTLRSSLGPPYDPNARFIVLDLAGVTFFDSTGLRALNETQQDAASNGMSIALVGVGAPITKLLMITGLNQSLPSFASAEQAIAALSDGS